MTTEVNENKNFAQLRQVYNSLILATWYKKKIKDSILEQVYADKNKVAGVNIDDPKEKEKIYQQYLRAFKKGVYNYIKEDVDPVTQETIPRKYFSGGEELIDIDKAMEVIQSDPKNFNNKGDLAVISTQINSVIVDAHPKEKSAAMLENFSYSNDSRKRIVYQGLTRKIFSQNGQELDSFRKKIPGVTGNKNY